MQLQKISIAEMCAAAPDLFCVGARQAEPSQTLEQWAAAQPAIKAASTGARIYAERAITSTQAKRMALYARIQAACERLRTVV